VHRLGVETHAVFTRSETPGSTGERDEEAKSADELEAMIMQELRKHPDWGHVLSVSVEPSGQQAPHPNWRAAFVADGERSTPGAAIQFAEILGAKYDLA